MAATRSINGHESTPSKDSTRVIILMIVTTTMMVIMIMIIILILILLLTVLMLIIHVDNVSTDINRRGVTPPGSPSKSTLTHRYRRL